MRPYPLIGQVREERRGAGSAILTEVHGVECLGAVESDDGDAVGEDAALDELHRGAGGHGGEAADEA
jgi:hypothetical protein